LKSFLIASNRYFLVVVCDLESDIHLSIPF
jgi:hypothetical protein